MKLSIVMSIFFIVVVPLSQTAIATECGLDNKFRHKTKHHGKRWVYENSSSLFFTAPMSVNTDGAPNSYHPNDPWGNKGLAINTICNGANALLPNGEVIDYSNCSSMVKAFREARDSGWDNPTKPRMQFYGMARQGYVPCVINSGDYEGYFVSTTSQTADETLGKCDQDRYLNALELPFIIYPGHKNFTKRGVGKRDIAVLYNPEKDVLEYAIVGDRGPRWGLAEGSVYLAKSLNKRDENPRTRKDTYRFVVPKVHTLVLSDLTIEPPYTLEKIQTEGKRAFDEWGGVERFNACVEKQGRRP